MIQDEIQILHLIILRSSFRIKVQYKISFHHHSPGTPNSMLHGSRLGNLKKKTLTLVPAVQQDFVPLAGGLTCQYRKSGQDQGFPIRRDCVHP